jgi:acetyl coenzyme A synthetase (ADP forming)-like protein
MADLELFFNPQSIAVIGASGTPGKIGFEVLSSIKEGGYEGQIFPISIKSEEPILGFEVFKSILDVPMPIDIAVFALSAKHAPKILEECGKKGVKGVVIISGGFKELGSEGRELEKKIMEIAKKYDIRIIGPNCMGILSPKAKLDTFFQPRYAMTRPKTGCVGVATQSGTFGISMLECFSHNDVGMSTFVSYGNKVDVDELDMLRYFEDDAETKVIALYVEGLTDGKRFVELARRISIKKPIIMLKGGRTATGSKAAASHTGSLASNDTVFVTAMRQSGILLVDDIDELLDTVKILAKQPLPSGNVIAMVTNGVGPCVVAADEIAKTENLSLAELKEQTISHLKSCLPPFCIFSNPVDITGSATASWFGCGLEALSGDDSVDILMPFFVFQDAPLAETIDEFHKIMKKINESEKTMLSVAFGGEYTRKQVNVLQENGMPVIPTSKRAILALSNVVWYADYLRRKKKSV